MACRWMIMVSLLLLVGHSIHGSPVAKKSPEKIDLIILHNNDMHARFEQTNVKSGKCSDEDTNTDKCYGGFARVAYEVRKYRKEAKNGGTPVFYLNAGDTYTGTPWFTVFKDNITAAFLNKLRPDAISLGNHEFDKNVEGLIPFLNNVEFPVLACNLDLRKVPELAATKHLVNSTVLHTNGIKIGIIGYLTPDTKHLSIKNDVEFNEEIVSINAEAQKFKERGINIIIALGHSGYKKDLEIAKNCPEVDIVIGGHTNTFLYNGVPPDVEAIDGPYPTKVTQKGGKVVPVVQAYAYTKYLGKLHVQFDANGNLIEFDGSPILLNASVPQEQELLNLLEVYRPNITALDTKISGYTMVDLDGKTCRAVECNLGNLITDSMVFASALQNHSADVWTNTSIALLQGGGIRSSIAKDASGKITATDIYTVLPFENDLYMTRVYGKTLRKALERSAAVRAKDSNGGFLQMSGIKVEYNYNKTEGHRVVSVNVRCANCTVPFYAPLNNSAYYNVIVTFFLLNNGDGFELQEKENPLIERLEQNDQEALELYLKYHKYVYPEIEGRIVYKTSAANTLSYIVLVWISVVVTRVIN